MDQENITIGNSEENNEEARSLTNALSEEQKGFDLTKTLYLIVGAFVLIIAVSAISWLVLFEKGPLTNVPPVDPFADLRGRIHMTLASKGDNAADLYTLTLPEKRLEKVLDDGYVKYTGKVSPQGGMLAYAAAPLDRNSEFFFPYTEFLQIYTLNIETGIVNKLTNSETKAKRLPSWSPDGGRVVFTAQFPDATAEDFLIPNEWGVGIVDLEGNTERVTFGTAPLWSPDGTKLLLLRNDGLYLYNLLDNSVAQVQDLIGGDASTNMKISLSKSGSLLAWSVPNTRKLLIFNVTSWEPFEMNVSQEIDTGSDMVFWPVFSPDNIYLAYQKAEVLNGVPQNPSVVAYNIDTREETSLMSLDGYNFDVAFITDWEQK